MLAVYCMVLRAVLTYQIKQAEDRQEHINLANILTIRTVIPMYYEISRRQLKVPDSRFLSRIEVRDQGYFRRDEFM